MSEADPIRAEDFVADPHLDDDDQLKSVFVRQVFDAVEAGEDERVRELVSPLHPADIADLFEQAPSELRSDLAASLAGLLDGDVIAELNDHVREELIDTLDPREVADIASELETDDAVAIIEDMEEEDQRAVLRELSRTIVRQSRKRFPIPRSPPAG